ncbi:MAG: hypothetical protein ACKO6K_00545 [Chitinophagaceae bacterium]
MQNSDHSRQPEHYSPCLRALLEDQQGHWDNAHQLIQDLDTQDAAWVHAYLHRKEGDLANADYWYRRAGRKRPDLSWQEEWSSLKEYFLEKERKTLF